MHLAEVNTISIFSILGPVNISKSMSKTGNISLVLHDVELMPHNKKKASKLKINTRCEFFSAEKKTRRSFFRTVN